jgi:hypothetical protein
MIVGNQKQGERFVVHGKMQRTFNQTPRPEEIVRRTPTRNQHKEVYPGDTCLSPTHTEERFIFQPSTVPTNLKILQSNSSP